MSWFDQGTPCSVVYPMYFLPVRRRPSPVNGPRDVSQAPLIVSVQVERRRCGACGACAWASDNWRKTSVFNYNNYFLVELSLLYKCLRQFIRGTTIQSFFSAHLEPLATNIAWLLENPDLAARYDAGWDY